MNSKTKTILSVVIFAGFMGVAVFAYNALSSGVMPLNTTTSSTEKETDTEKEEEEKIEAPAFTVIDKDGNEVNFSDFKGKPIVLNCWASWCSPCKKEMPEFNKLYSELGDEVIFMMINMTDGKRETLEKAQKYIEYQGFEFPVYYDTKQDVSAAYGVSSFPTTFFIDKDGYVITGAVGVIDEATILKGINIINPKDTENLK